jgi:hypothetical protein
MSNLGMTVMLGLLRGNEETVRAIKAAIGKKIKLLELKDGQVICELENGGILILEDNGQSCCEHRYMCTDDARNFAGETLVDVELREAPDVGDASEVHEVQFLVLKTDKGEFVVSTHNEHNGYYGGFSIEATYNDTHAAG